MDTVNLLKNEPVFLVLLTLVAVSLALVFFLLVLPPSALKKIRRNLKIVALAFLIPLLLVGSYFLYQVYQEGRLVKILSAAEFKEKKFESIQLIQREGLSGSERAKLYLLDIRSREDYAREHLVGSASLPADRATKEMYPIEETDLAIYSVNSEFGKARRVADAIKENGDSIKYKYQEKIGKIYVISDGFEGLKNAGLATESGVWD